MYIPADNKTGREVHTLIRGDREVSQIGCYRTTANLAVRAKNTRAKTSKSVVILFLSEKPTPTGKYPNSRIASTIPQGRSGARANPPTNIHSSWTGLSVLTTQSIWGVGMPDSKSGGFSTPPTTLERLRPPGYLRQATSHHIQALTPEEKTDSQF